MISLPDLYPVDAPIDQTSYCILLSIRETDGTPWKTALTKKLNNKREQDNCSLGHKQGITLQTITRRVADLRHRGYVEQRAKYIQAANRYLQVYDLTAQAEHALRETSDRMMDQLTILYAEKCVRSQQLHLPRQLLKKIAQNPMAPLQSEAIDDLREEFRSRLDFDINSTIRVD